MDTWYRRCREYFYSSWYAIYHLFDPPLSLTACSSKALSFSRVIRSRVLLAVLLPLVQHFTSLDTTLIIMDLHKVLISTIMGDHIPFLLCRPPRPTLAITFSPTPHSISKWPK